MDSNESDLAFKNDNSKKIVINIIKDPSSSKKIKKNENDPKYFTENKSQIDSKVLSSKMNLITKPRIQTLKLRLLTRK